MKEKKRIVVTGTGIVSCLGHDVHEFYQNLLDGKSGIKPISAFPCEDYPTRFAGVISDFDPGEYLDKKQARRVDKFIAYAAVAAKKALEQSKLSQEKLDEVDKARIGVIVGSGMGGMDVFSEGVLALKDKGPARVTPFFVPYIISNMAGGVIAIDLGLMGPNYSISTACATANNSIIAAAQHIWSGEADIMIAGGTEAAVIPMGLAGFCACKALSKRNEEPVRASRPWDKGRDGFVLGEGAGVIILEELEHALKRGAPILAEYLGGGLSCDGYHMTEPRADGAGVVACVKMALRHAGIKPEDVNYINAHATSTPLGDMAEITALKKVFSQPESIVINATKSMIGHSLGAAGGMEAVAVVQAIQTGLIHPTINLEDPEDIGFYAPTKAEQVAVKYAISNSFGFGGHNATLVLARYIP